MRIADVRPQAAALAGAEGHELQRMHMESPQSFSRHLTELGEDVFGRQIAAMVQQISDQGKKLSQRADMQQFIRYRETVAALMHEVVSNAYAFRRRNTFDARGRQRIFALINRVNAKLDQLARDLIEEQQDNLKLLRDIEEIRGMLVDMLL